MSRIGKKLVQIPSGVEVTISDSELKIKGPKGELSLDIHPRVKFKQETEGEVNVLIVSVLDENADKAMWGTFRALAANMVKGVTEGFSKTLELNGVGFKMALQGTKLNLKLGFSHDINYELPKELDVNIEGNTITIAGADAQMVGQAAAEIRAFKKPEPYKGKGFKYDDEVIRRKVGKAAKTE